MKKEQHQNNPYYEALAEEAAKIRQQALTHVQDSDLPVYDPEAGYARLLERLEEKAPHAPAAKPRGKVLRLRTAVVLAAVLVLTLVLGLGTFGEKLYTPEAVTEHRDGEVIIKINNDEYIETQVEEEAVYQEIEERLGIWSLRLGYKPVGMEVFRVEIQEEFGEARIHYLCEDQVFSVYMNRNYKKTGLSVKYDGETIDTVESFSVKEPLEVLKLKSESGEISYFTQFTAENVAYVMEGVIEKEEFLKIIQGIYYKNA